VFVIGGGLATRPLWDESSGRAEVERSVAVLPFTNLSQDPDNEYFSDGLTEEILTTLSGVGDLRVISRTSAMRYKGSDKPLRQIASELGVAHVLEGSVQRAGDQVRINVQLIDAGTDRQLWISRTRHSRSTPPIRMRSRLAPLLFECATGFEERLSGSIQPSSPLAMRFPLIQGSPPAMRSWALRLRCEEIGGKRSRRIAAQWS
jgi:TolB-like protein